MKKITFSFYCKTIKETHKSGTKVILSPNNAGTDTRSEEYFHGDIELNLKEKSEFEVGKVYSIDFNPIEEPVKEYMAEAPE